MIKKNRQVAPNLLGIRDDHLERYKFAARKIKEYDLWDALDVGCGCGYGSYVLAQRGIHVQGYDVDPEAIAYGNEFYKINGVQRYAMDLKGILPVANTALVMFEIIEHSFHAPEFLLKCSHESKLLVLSVPNQAAVPFGPKSHPEHYRHYTAEEMAEELDQCGWRPVFCGSQPGKHGKEALIIENNTRGRTLVFVAVPKS